MRRVRTNTSTLTLLNDGLVRSAAALARLHDRGTSPRGRRAASGIRLPLSRDARLAELDVSCRYEAEQAHYRAAGASAESADADAWKLVANVLLNLDEAITKE